jgi:hypothetical protein
MDRRIRKELEKELGRWSGITGHSFKQIGKHPRLVINTADDSRFVTMSLTASDHRATKNKIGDLRKVLRELGAEKD